jgi:hypothetical protein
MKTIAPVHELLQKKVSRREFVQIAGFGILSLVGMSSIIHLLTGKKNPLTKQLKSTGTGFGSGFYNR